MCIAIQFNSTQLIYNRTLSVYCNTIQFNATHLQSYRKCVLQCSSIQFNATHLQSYRKCVLQFNLIRFNATHLQSYRKCVSLLRFRYICRREKEIVSEAVNGAKLAIAECQFQFKGINLIILLFYNV